MAVLADDLSGANISAALLTRAGLRTRVVWSPDKASASHDVDALSVDMRTRDRPGDPRGIAHGWTQAVRAAGATQIELRIDSTLRGMTSEELDGVLAAHPNDPVVCVAAAFPSADRVTDAGQQVACGQLVRPVAEVGRVVFGERPFVRVASSTLDGGAGATKLTVEDALRSGARRFVFDGSEEEHLRVFSQTVRGLRNEGREVVTVSPGAWLRYAVQSPFALVVIGSPTPANRAQLEVLKKQPGTVVVSSLAGGLQEADLASMGKAMTLVVHSFDGPHNPELAAVSLSTAARDLLVAQADRPCSGIVATGGHTASHLADVLGASGLMALREPEPLCAEGVVLGGRWDNLPFVTKGGQIGGPEALARLRFALS